jgi:hypothetical protein
MPQNLRIQEPAELALQADGGHLRACVIFQRLQRQARSTLPVLTVRQTGRHRRSIRFQTGQAVLAGMDDLEEQATCGVSRSTWCHLNQGRQWTFDFSTDLISSCAVSLRKVGCPNLPALHRMPGGTGLVVWEVVDAQRQV